MRYGNKITNHNLTCCLYWVSLVVSLGAGTVQGVVGGTGGIPGTSAGAGSNAFKKYILQMLKIKWLGKLCPTIWTYSFTAYPGGVKPPKYGKIYYH